MESETKQCERCGSDFYRHKKLSQVQWDSRRFCSKRCAGIRKELDFDEIKHLYLSGKSSNEIAPIVGISGVHVLRTLHSIGVELRDASEGKRLSHARPDVKARMSASATGRLLSEAAKDKLRAIFGPAHAGWKGGITESQGYRCFTASRANGENANKGEHRVIAAKKEGRQLDDREIVHHRDRNRSNNDPLNLEVMASQSEHAKHHWGSGDMRRKKDA